MNGSYASFCSSLRPGMFARYLVRVCGRSVGGCRRKVNKRTKLEEIWEMAGKTVAFPHALGSLAVETFRITLRKYQELNAPRTELELRAGQALKTNADFAHLKTVARYRLG